MTTIADYTDRLVDVSALQGAVATGEVELRMRLADDGEGGRIVTGIAKLGQRFLMELFTEKGSMTFQPATGSTFLTELRAGRVRTPGELIGAFHRAMLDVTRNLQAAEETTDPADELFASATVDRVRLSNTAAVMYITLSSQDPAAKAILPLPVVV